LDGISYTSSGSSSPVATNVRYLRPSVWAKTNSPIRLDYIQQGRVRERAIPGRRAGVRGRAAEDTAWFELTRGGDPDVSGSSARSSRDPALGGARYALELSDARSSGLAARIQHHDPRQRQGTTEVTTPGRSRSAQHDLVAGRACPPRPQGFSILAPGGGGMGARRAGSPGGKGGIHERTGGAAIPAVPRRIPGRTARPAAGARRGVVPIRDVDPSKGRRRSAPTRIPHAMRAGRFFFFFFFFFFLKGQWAHENDADARGDHQGTITSGGPAGLSGSINQCRRGSGGIRVPGAERRGVGEGKPAGPQNGGTGVEALDQGRALAESIRAGHAGDGAGSGGSGSSVVRCWSRSRPHGWGGRGPGVLRRNITSCGAKSRFSCSVALAISPGAAEARRGRQRPAGHGKTGNDVPLERNAGGPPRHGRPPRPPRPRPRTPDLAVRRPSHFSTSEGQGARRGHACLLGFALKEHRGTGRPADGGLPGDPASRQKSGNPMPDELRTRTDPRLFGSAPKVADDGVAPGSRYPSGVGGSTHVPNRPNGDLHERLTRCRRSSERQPRRCAWRGFFFFPRGGLTSARTATCRPSGPGPRPNPGP